MKFKEPNPYLYVIMRTDMDSMNAGKGMAQSNHAGIAFVKKIEEIRASLIEDIKNNIESHDRSSKEIVVEMYDTWKRQTKQGFGNTVTLDASKYSNRLQFFLEDYVINHEFPCVWEVVDDPSYPIRDGRVTHAVDIPTCAYFFSDKEATNIDLKLHA